jgi:FkbM family methyltransferase
MSAGRRSLLERAAGVVKSRDRQRIWMARGLTLALKRLNPDLKVLGLTDDEGTTFMHLDDKAITPAIVVRGHFHRTDLEQVWALARPSSPRPTGGWFVDVGANIGTTSLYAVRTGDFAGTVALEPSPDNLTVLRLNVAANELEGQVHVVGAACGAEAGSIGLWMSDVAQSDHRVDRGQAPSTHARRVEVAVVTLDDTLAELGIDPADLAIVWIDTQGHEPGVLDGGRKALASGAPFCIELWPGQYREAGTLDTFLDLVDAHFAEYVDIHAPGAPRHPIGEFRALVDRLLAVDGQTDVVLLPAR